MPVIHGGGGGDLDVMFLAGDEEGNVFLESQNGIRMVMVGLLNSLRRKGKACFCVWPKLGCSSLIYICCRPIVLGKPGH